MELHFQPETEEVELIHSQGNWILKQGRGFSPVQMTVAAVAACSTYVFEEILTNSKVPFEFHQIMVRYSRAEERPARPISRVMIDFHMIVPMEFQDKTQRITKMISRHCPVIQSLDPTIVVEENVLFS